MATVGLSMIVKNGGDDLRLCLRSVEGLVSEIVIADTGSTDHSLEIAAEFNARVIYFPWNNSFADARNASLRQMTTDWVLVLDADEELSHEAVDRIPKLLEDSQETGGYFLTIRNYLPDLNVQFRSVKSMPNVDKVARATRALSWAEHDLCRLFKRDSSIHYSGRVHEVVEYSILSSGLKLQHSGCRILHFGQLAGSDVHTRKATFYRDLGRAKVNEEPGNAMAWFELGGIELSQFNHQPAAMQCLQTAVRLEPRLIDAWILLFHLHDSRAEYEFALDVYRRLVALHAPLSFEILLRAGDYLHDRGQLPEAQDCYQKAFQMATMDGVGVSFLSRWVAASKLGYTEVRLGLPEGLNRLKEAASEAPSIQENQNRFIKALLLSGDVVSAQKAAAELPKLKIAK